MVTRRIALLLCCLFLGTGCVARVVPGPAYVEAEYVPADIELYPHTYYEGRVVYLVNDRWYYRHGPGWVYYRSEPRPLYSQRQYYYRQYGRSPYVYRERPYVQQAPPARRYYDRRGAPTRRGPPPGLRESQPAYPRQAPPAYPGR